jgi:hypothetical protein
MPLAAYNPAPVRRRPVDRDARSRSTIRAPGATIDPIA